MPSPVQIAPLVVKGKTRPAPPVARMTAPALINRMCPVRSSTATTPWQRPFSTTSRVANHSSYRRMDENCSEVWKSVCSRWKPVLSAANQVRSFCIPPKGRTATLPSGSAPPGPPPVLYRQQPRGPLGGEELHRVLIGQPVRAADRVLDVFVQGVVGLDHPAGAAFRGDGGAAHGGDPGGGGGG